MTVQQKEVLLGRVEVEARRARLAAYVLPVHMDLTTMLSFIGTVQLALRHPRMTGPSAQLAREVIEAMIGRLKADGFHAHAELAALGFDPQHDEAPV